MNHLYQFTPDGSPWSSPTWNVSTDKGKCLVEVRRGSDRLLTCPTATELRLLATALLSAADALEFTGRQQHDAWLDRRAA
jgi:hypothetical protein